MSNASHDLVLLIRLQGVYDSISRSIAERNTPPPEIRELQEANRLREQELEEFEKQVAANEEELKAVRKKEIECELELEHFQKQKGMVTNEREFTAVISEIDYATKAIEETLSRRQELEETNAQLKAEIETRRATGPEEDAVHKKVVASWEARKKKILRKVHKLAKEAKTLETEIHPKHRAQFLRLLESKRGTAIAAVVDGSCSVCHFALRPHLQQRVRRCEELIDCEHCHRILYAGEILEKDAT